MPPLTLAAARRPLSNSVSLVYSLIVSDDPRWESVTGPVQAAGRVQVTAEGATAPETLRPMYRAGRHLWKVDARVTPKG